MYEEAGFLIKVLGIIKKPLQHNIISILKIVNTELLGKIKILYCVFQVTGRMGE